MLRKDNRLLFLNFKRKEDIVFFINCNADLIRKAYIDLNALKIDCIYTESEEKAEELKRRFLNNGTFH